MAAFFQNLFKKRSTTATRPASSSKPSSAPRGRPTGDGASDAGEDSGQTAINAQRATLADTNAAQEILAQLAIEGLAANIRLEAARRLSDETLLHQVQKASRGRDKGVYQHVRQALQEIRQRQETEQATREAVEQLARDAEDLARTGDTSLYEARTGQLEKRWQSLEVSADNEQQTRILSSMHTCRQRLRELAEERQEEQRHQDQKQQRDETLTLLRETLDSLAVEAPAPVALPSLDALQRTQENRWLEATRETTVTRQEQKQYEALMLGLRAAIDAVRRLASHHEQLDALAAQDTTPGDQASDLLEQLAWPPQLARPEALRVLAQKARSQPAQAAPELENSGAQEEAARKLEAVLDELESSLADNQLKESRQHLKQAQGLQRQLGGKLGNRYRARLQRLSGQVHELGDWQGFATTPKQVALCEQMEYLTQQPMDPEAKAARIQELQQEWRGLGGSSDRELWQRFRAASETAFEPCRAYFEARSDLKQVHLHRRQAICEELARYLEGTDWSQVDWQAAEQIEKTARQEWREAWPVEFRDNRRVQKEFDRLMTNLASQLDNERHRNEERKQAIVDRARELTGHSPLAEAMDEAKALQKQWQNIGITRHREDRKLWKAFRAACDEIFARRDEQRQRREQETSESDKAAEPALAGAKALLSQEDVDEEAATEWIKSLEAAAGTPVSAEVGKELRQTAAQLTERRRQLQQVASMRQWQQWINQRLVGDLSPEELPAYWQELQTTVPVSDPRELVVLGEILAGCPSPDADQSLRMELQVKRLKEGFEGGQTPQSAGAGTLEAIVARWCVGLPRESLTPELAARLGQAVEAPAERSGA
jgi:exonuclease SbcC